MTRADSFDRIGWLTCVGVFIAMVVDGMDLQMLAVALPSIGADLGISNVMAGALSTYTFLGMGIGGILAGWLSDRIGRVGDIDNRLDALLRFRAALANVWRDANDLRIERAAVSTGEA